MDSFGLEKIVVKMIILLPLVKIIFLIGTILFFIEKIIYYLLLPILWIFTTIDAVKFVNEFSIIQSIGEKFFIPGCEKLGIYLEKR